MKNYVGIGYDSHRFAKGRRLVLGGVEIPYQYGLQGHSDADALLHAVTDAILGALGKGDIGEHFPDSDPAYRDADSTKLLGQVYEMVCREGLSLGNIDVVVLAQEPSLKPFKQAMSRRIAEVLHMQEPSVNIKASTNEGMGFVGRGEGIACFATVTLTGQDI